MRIYEAMFLFDPSFAADMSKVEQEVDRLMKRAGAEIIMSNKWDERKLAYEIEGRKRGCYVLTFFRAEPEKIPSIERDVQLSESVLRVLILKRDYMTEDDMKQAYNLRSQPAGLGDRPGRPAGAPTKGPGRAAPAEKPAEAEVSTAVVEPSDEVPETPAPEATESAASTATATEPETTEQPTEPQ